MEDETVPKIFTVSGLAEGILKKAPVEDEAVGGPTAYIRRSDPKQRTGVCRPYAL